MNLLPSKLPLKLLLLRDIPGIYELDLAYVKAMHYKLYTDITEKPKLVTAL